MKIEEVKVEIDSRTFSHESHVRSGGLHLSHIIRSIEEDNYGLMKGEGMDPQALEVYRTAGFLFERALYDVILEDLAISRLGEFELDGIIMTPDAVDMINSRGIESKCTWRSMGHDVTDIRGEYSSWWMQIMGYAKALGILDWDLWVLFINGDYRKNRRPQIRHWDIKLEQEEVDANWKMIKNHGQWMKESGRV